MTLGHLLFLTSLHSGLLSPLPTSLCQVGYQSESLVNSRRATVWRVVKKGVHTPVASVPASSLNNDLLKTVSLAETSKPFTWVSWPIPRWLFSSFSLPSEVIASVILKGIFRSDGFPTLRYIWHLYFSPGKPLWANCTLSSGKWLRPLTLQGAAVLQGPWVIYRKALKALL